MHRFYWVRPGSLAGCSRPGATDESSLVSDLQDLRGRGITSLLSLTEEPLDTATVAAAGLDCSHVPIADMTAPTPAQLRAALAVIEDAHRSGSVLAVHCLGGRGRTGTVLAAWLITHGATADDAVATIRAQCPEAIETETQAAALRDLERQTDRASG